MYGFAVGGSRASDGVDDEAGGSLWTAAFCYFIVKTEV